jgi:hypothetical protein
MLELKKRTQKRADANNHQKNNKRRKKEGEKGKEKIKTLFYERISTLINALRVALNLNC